MHEFTSLGPLGDWGPKKPPEKPILEQMHGEAKVSLPVAIQGLPEGTQVYSLTFVRRDVGGTKGLEAIHKIGKDEGEEWEEIITPVVVAKLLCEVAEVLHSNYPGLFLMDMLTEELRKHKETDD